MSKREGTRGPRPSLATERAGRSAQGQGQPARVLLVEDDVDVRKAFRVFLERHGYEVETAGGGEEAVALLEYATFDVIVSDIRMPGMNGVQLLDTVRKRDKDTPVVLVTGDPELETAVAAVEHGALRYLTKPVDLKQLALVISKAVRINRVAQRRRAEVSSTSEVQATRGRPEARAVSTSMLAPPDHASQAGAAKVFDAAISPRPPPAHATTTAAHLAMRADNRQDLSRLRGLSGSGAIRTRSTQGVTGSPHVALQLDENGRIALVNEQWRAFALANGADPHTVEGVGLDYVAVCAACDEPDSQLVALSIRDVLARRRRRFTHVYACHAEQELRWFRLEVSALENERPGALVSHVDITELYLATARLNIQMSVAKAFRPGMSMLDACRTLALKVCQELDWDYAGIWTLDVASWTLRCVDSWIRPGQDLASFQRATRAAALGPGVGLPGRAWVSAKVQWATDQDTAAGPHRGPSERARVMPPSAIQSGFRTALSFPIKCGDDVLAVVDVFSRVRRSPDRALMELLEASGDQLALWELRERAEECAWIAQKEADDARSLLESVLSCAPAFVMAMDREGRIQFVNRALSPSRKDDVIESHWKEHVPERWQPTVQAALDSVLSTGSTENYELPIGQAGRPMWLANHMGPMRNGDRITGAVVVSQDITPLKLAQSELTDAQRLVSVGTLAAGVAHEINTPIQFVNDSVHFLRDAGRDIFALLDTLLATLRVAEEGAPSRAQEKVFADAREAEEQADLDYLRSNIPKAFDRAVEGLERVATIVRSMKEFAHPAQVEMAPADLNRAIVTTLTVARNEYKYVADLTTDLGELPPVTCHLNEVNQVVLNLVVNAAHAIAEVVKDSGQKGTIKVCTRNEGTHAVISIADTGGGIPAHVQPRIFDPFFTTKEVGKGTGQGLAMARATIKDKHGGELSFTTELGKGTTFFIRLPLGRASEATQ